jgi:hypothetical protein
MHVDDAPVPDHGSSLRLADACVYWHVRLPSFSRERVRRACNPCVSQGPKPGNYESIGAMSVLAPNSRPGMQRLYEYTP